MYVCEAALVLCSRCVVVYVIGGVVTLISWHGAPWCRVVPGRSVVVCVLELYIREDERESVGTQRLAFPLAHCYV